MRIKQCRNVAKDTEKVAENRAERKITNKTVGGETETKMVSS